MHMPRLCTKTLGKKEEMDVLPTLSSGMCLKLYARWTSPMRSSFMAQCRPTTRSCDLLSLPKLWNTLVGVILWGLHVDMDNHDYCKILAQSSVGAHTENRILQVRADPKLYIRWWWRDTQISRKRLVVRFSAVKSPLYLTEHLPGGQPPHVLWRWLVGTFCL